MAIRRLRTWKGKRELSRFLLVGYQPMFAGATITRIDIRGLLMEADIHVS